MTQYWVYRGRHDELLLWHEISFAEAFEQMNRDDGVSDGDEEYEYEGSEAEGRVSRDEGGQLDLIETEER